MPRQSISDLRLTTASEYHPSQAPMGPDGQTFESTELCRAEDAKRVRLLHRVLSRPDRLISRRNARRLAVGLARWPRRRRARTLASSVDMRLLRNRVFSQLWRLVAKCKGLVTTFTVVKRAWEFTPEELDEANLDKLLAGFLSDLNRRGAGGASGWLIAFIHGEFETPAGIYRLHLHGVAAEGMIDVVDKLRKGAKYKNDNTVHCRVRIDRKPLEHLPYPLTYCFKSYWPRKHVIMGVNGKRRTRRHMRIPEPYHSQVLAFLDRHQLDDLGVMKHLEVVRGQLRRTKRS
jgi:hypothetical protein